MKAARNAITRPSLDVEIIDDAQRLVRGMFYGGMLAAPFWIGVLALLLR